MVIRDIRAPRSILLLQYTVFCAHIGMHNMHSKKVSPSLPDSRCIEEGGGTASCQAMSAEALKAEGNAHFAEGRLDAAMRHTSPPWILPPMTAAPPPTVATKTASSGRRSWPTSASAT